jgi:drug/metabolite transporter (DMT)-like permease
MIYLQFALGFLIYQASAYISHLKNFQQTNWYYPLGIGLSVFANYLWLNIAKNSVSSSSTLIYALYWDIMLSLCFVIVPIVFFDVKLTLNLGIGILLILVGIGFTKL